MKSYIVESLFKSYILHNVWNDKMLLVQRRLQKCKLDYLQQMGSRKTLLQTLLSRVRSHCCFTSELRNLFSMQLALCKYQKKKQQSGRVHSSFVSHSYFAILGAHTLQWRNFAAVCMRAMSNDPGGIREIKSTARNAIAPFRSRTSVRNNQATWCKHERCVINLHRNANACWNKRYSMAVNWVAWNDTSCFQFLLLNIFFCKFNVYL